MRGVDCGTGLMMLRMKLKLPVRHQVKWNGIKAPKRVNISRLKDPKIKEKLQGVFGINNFDGIWDQFKTNAEVLGYVDRNIGISLIKIIPKLISFWKPGTNHTKGTSVHLRNTERCCSSLLKMLSYHCCIISAK